MTAAAKYVPHVAPAHWLGERSDMAAIHSRWATICLPSTTRIKRQTFAEPVPGAWVDHEHR